MKLGFASQYKTACVILEEGDTAQEVIDRCYEEMALFIEEGEPCPVVDTGRGVGPELYTELSLRRSFTGPGETFIPLQARRNRG